MQHRLFKPPHPEQIRVISDRAIKAPRERCETHADKVHKRNKWREKVRQEMKENGYIVKRTTTITSNDGDRYEIYKICTCEYLYKKRGSLRRSFVGAILFTHPFYQIIEEAANLDHTVNNPIIDVQEFNNSSDLFDEQEVITKERRCVIT